MVVILLGSWEGSLEEGWPVSFANFSFTDISFTDDSFTKVVDHGAFWVASSSTGSSSIHCLFEWVDFLVVFMWRCRRREVRSGERSGVWRFTSGAPE